MPTTTSTTTPAPCICEISDDEFTINVETNLFWEYTRSSLRVDLLVNDYYYDFEFQNRWRLNGKMFEFEKNNNPLQNPATPKSHNFWTAPIPLTFKKLNPPVIQEGCDVYVSALNSLPLGLLLIAGEGDKDAFNIVMTFMAKLFLLDGVWTIGWYVSGNFDQLFKPRRMTTNNICPMDGGFIDGTVLALLNPNFYEILAGNVQNLDTVAMMMPPFKNSVLGY